MSKPDKVTSVSPHEASISYRTVASNESPTTNEEVIIAEAITNPANNRAAWRFLLRTFSLAILHTTNLCGTSKGWINTWLISPKLNAPAHNVGPLIVNQSRTKYAIIPSATGPSVNKVIINKDNFRLLPISRVDTPHGIPIKTKRIRDSINRITPPLRPFHYQ